MSASRKRSSSSQCLRMASCRSQISTMASRQVCSSARMR
jgi:hypothetical protein